MSWISDAVAEYGRRLGLEDWTLDGQGVAQLALESGDVLALEAVGDEVLVYNVHPAPYAAPALWIDALQRCHLRRRGQWPVQVGVRGSAADARLVILTRMSQRALTPQSLESAIDAVLRWRAGWNEGRPERH